MQSSTTAPFTPSNPRFFTPSHPPLSLPEIRAKFDVPIEQIHAPSGKPLFKIKGLSVYSETAEGLKDLHQFIENLPIDSDLGKFAYKELISQLKETDPKLPPKVSIFGWDKPYAIHKDSQGLFSLNASKFHGINTNTSIHIAQQRIVLGQRLTFAHETTHWLLYTTSSCQDPNPFLTYEYPKKFQKLFQAEKARLAINPHPPGSLKHNIHNLLYDRIFNRYLAYHPLMRQTEIPAFFLQFELGAGKGLLREFSPKLTDAFLEVIQGHNMPVGFLNNRPPVNFHFDPGYQDLDSLSAIAKSKPQTIPTSKPRILNPPPFQPSVNNIPPSDFVPISEIRATRNPKPFQQKLLAIGKNVESSFFKIANNPKVLKTFRGLKIGGTVALSGPLDIYFAYDKTQEHALEKAFANGTATFALNFAANALLVATIGGLPTLVITLSSVAAEMLPNLHEVEKSLPNDDQLRAIGQQFPEMEALLRQDRVFLKIGASIQDFLRKCNPTRVWNEHFAPQVNAKIDDSHGPGNVKKLIAQFDGKLPIVEDPYEQFFQHLSKEFDDYLSLNPITSSGDQIQPRHSHTATLHSPYHPDLSTLQLDTSPTNMDDLAFIRDIEERLDQAALDWAISSDEHGHQKTISTKVEIPADELAAIDSLQPDDDQLPSTTSPRPVLLSSASPEREEKPKFRDLAQITSVSTGPGIGGGYGLVFTLASGAKFSLSTTGNGIITGISAPLTKGFFSTIATGLVYQIPVVASLLAIHQLCSLKSAKIEDHLKDDAKQAKRESSKINASLIDYDRFFNEFNSGHINRDDFIRTTNHLSHQLQKSAHNNRKRGHYQDNHTENLLGDNHYFFQQTQLRQIDLDLKNMAEKALLQKEVNSVFVPQIQSEPLANLVDRLVELSAKRVLSLKEGYQQLALYNEILARANSESIEGIDHIDRLASIPLALTLDLAPVAKPAHISESKFVKKMDDYDWFQKNKASNHRRYERIKSWANKVDQLYSDLGNACKSGNVPEIRRLHGLLIDQLDRTNGQHGSDKVNLHKYKVTLYDSSTKTTHRSAADYYRTYIEQIRNGANVLLVRANAAEQGQISELNPAYFSPQEIAQWKTILADRTFNESLAQFSSENTSPEQLDAAFNALYLSAQAKKQQQSPTDQPNDQIDQIVAIGSKFPSYSRYLQVQGRLATLTAIEDAFTKMKAKDIKQKEYEKHYKTASEAALALLEQGFSLDDLKYYLPEDQAQSIVDWISSIPQAYKDHLTLRQYQTETLPMIGSPLAKMFLTVLHDLAENRGPLFKAGVKLIDRTNSFAPQFLPNAMNYLFSLSQERNATVAAGLANNCFSALSNNVLVTSRLPNAPLQSQLGAVQLISGVVADLAEYGDYPKVAQVANTVGFVANKSSSSLQYLLLAKRSIRYLQTGNYIQKIDKVGDTLVSTAMACFDIYEFLAKDPSEFGWTSNIVQAVKTYLPNFHGDLPETPFYYGAKDLFQFSGYAALGFGTLQKFGLADKVPALRPVLRGFAFLQGATTLWKAINGKYIDGAASAIMINLRWLAKQKQTPEIKQKIASSMGKLQFWVGDLNVSESDTPLWIKAKVTLFEHELSEYYANQQWQEIIDLTDFSLTTFRFNSRNIDLFHSIPSLNKRYNAFLALVAHNREYGAQNCQAHIMELDNAIGYIETKYDQLEPVSLQNTKETFAELRLKFIHNFCVYYISEEIQAPTELALAYFDSIPPSKRKVLHWYTLGTIIENFQNRNPELIELQMFCFETILTILDTRTELNPFEAEIKQKSLLMLQQFTSTIRSERNYNPKTIKFEPIITRILNATPTLT